MLHEIIFIIALSSEDFFASSTNISQRTSQSQFQTLLRLMLNVKSNEAMQYFTNDLQNHAVTAFQQER